MATTTLTQGIEEYQSDITFGNGIDVTGTGAFSGAVTLLKPISSITDATQTVTAAESGTVFSLNRAGGIVVTLPAAAVGLNYKFHIGTTGTGTLTINAATSADTLQGMVTIIDKDEVGGLAALNENIDTLAFCCPAAADHQLVMDADTKGRFIGGMIEYTCLSASKWVVTGHLFGDGTAATPFT
ncbi:hypothetical protein OAV83_00055 [bacterium]|nr:hypothetical protein [bacterium]